MATFVKRVEQRTGAKYHATTVSMLERNEQSWRIADVEAFAAVDPLNRGRAWLATFDREAAVSQPLPNEEAASNNPVTTPGGVGEFEQRAIPAERPSAKKADDKGRRRA